ncbi:hypothetical protein [Bacillus sp. ISL-57]|uniref:hypothetical protein n=1 Tax=Bacillus sp. ISL-57 TaxID=2819135 RepID=UPI001BECE6F9|nr:hypothetical protein [Bacillus sp. ISL-57]MBT2718285.1 hypothetical protein [Bacillus sp. ISL-57]
MELIKEIQLDSKEVEEAIADYLKKEGYKAVSFRFKSNNPLLPVYPLKAAIVVEEIRVE